MNPIRRFVAVLAAVRERGVTMSKRATAALSENATEPDEVFELAAGYLLVSWGEAKSALGDSQRSAKLTRQATTRYAADVRGCPAATRKPFGFNT